MTDLFDKEKDNKDDKNLNDGNGSEDSGNKGEEFLSLILNDEGKPKYENVEEALKGSVHAQAHIIKLEEDNKLLREKAEGGADMNKILEALKSSGSDKEGDNDETSDTSGVSQEDVTKLIETIISKRDSDNKEGENVQLVTDTFVSLFGDKASETLYGKAKDLGFSNEEINSMIAVNPTAALKVLGVSDKKVTITDPALSGGSVNSNSLNDKGDDKPVSSMGYLKTGELESNWAKQKAATNKRLGIEST